MKNFLYITLFFMQCSNSVTKNLQGYSHNTNVQNIDVNGLPMNISEHFDKIGRDTSIVLNNYELIYFQEIIKDKGFSYDFSDKKLYFLGPGGLIFSDKQKYFNDLRENKFRMQCTLYIFNATQKAESGGYDAAIVYWNKSSIPIEKVVKRLKKSNNR